VGWSYINTEGRVPLERMIEHKLIEIIESLNRIMSKWEKLILRRTILNIFTILLFIQVIVTFILWVFGRAVCNTWLGVLTIEFGAWGTMLAFYFNERGKDDRHE
jgi:type IV secretory pathway TrbL component